MRSIRNGWKKLSQGAVSLAHWADGENETRIVFKLVQLLHQLDRSHRREDVFLCDRLAILMLARHSEQQVEGKTFEDLVLIAEQRLAEQKNRWSRRALGFLDINRAGNLLYAKFGPDAEREDIIRIECKLPQTVQSRLLSEKNIPLEAILDLPGLSAMKLRAKRIAVTQLEGRGYVDIYTDRWDRSKLCVLKPKALPSNGAPNERRLERLRGAPSR